MSQNGQTHFKDLGTLYIEWYFKHVFYLLFFCADILLYYLLFAGIQMLRKS